MLIRNASRLEHRSAGDRSLLCELLHPDHMKGLGIDCSIAHALVPAGERTLPHRLKASAEIYFILSGEGRIIIDEEARKMIKGDMVYIPAGSVRYIENIGQEDLEFLAIVDPRWRQEDEEILEGRDR